MVSEGNKTVVRRLVAEVLDELYAPELVPATRRWIAPFRASFPDVHMEIVRPHRSSSKAAAAESRCNLPRVL